MPQMMPMLWTLIFMSSLLSLFFLSAMIYFFYVPAPYSLSLKKINQLTLKSYQWKWMW